MSYVHPKTWHMLLIDDGARDTIVRCSVCGRKFCFTYQGEFGNVAEWRVHVVDLASEEHQLEFEP
jgi:hypothetical protein